MDPAQWNPAAGVTSIQTSSEINCKQALESDLEHVPFKNEQLIQAQGVNINPVHSDEGLSRQLELIRRRQSQYTPIATPPNAPVLTAKNPDNGARRALFCTSLEDGVEM